MTSLEYNEGVSAHYHDNVYSPSSWDSWLWNKVQRPWVLRSLDLALPSERRATYLDFASGSGRVLAVLAPLFPESWGVDVSGPMLDRARSAAPEARLAKVDLLGSGSSAIEFRERFAGRLDLVTAFRFLLNSSPAERGRIVEVVHELLRAGGVALFHNHGNIPSAREIGFRLTGRGEAESLSHRACLDLLSTAGFIPKSQLHCGFLPRRLFTPRRAGAFAFAELAAARFSARAHFGNESLYLVEKLR